MKENLKRIFIIDKASQRRDALASRFRLQGYYVELSSSGMFLLSELEERLYQSIIVIEETSDISSYELISLLRDLYNSDELQIILSKKTKNPKIIDPFLDLDIQVITYNDNLFAPFLKEISNFSPPLDVKINIGIIPT